MDLANLETFHERLDYLISTQKRLTGRSNVIIPNLLGFSRGKIRTPKACIGYLIPGDTHVGFTPS